MANRTRRIVACLTSLAACAAFLVAEPASAQSVIKRPGAHPDYVFEAEPHLIFRDRHDHAGMGFGPGFRGTVVIVDQGFISKINNSVGIGFGLDILMGGGDHCHGGRGNNRGTCHDHGTQFVLPVVMQWNFWLHKKWSVFGEPGFAMVLGDVDHGDDNLDFDPFIFNAGGRFHFTDTISLTMRVGLPAQLSVGVSFLL